MPNRRRFDGFGTQFKDGETLVRAIKMDDLFCMLGSHTIGYEYVPRVHVSVGELHAVPGRKGCAVRVERHTGHTGDLENYAREGYLALRKYLTRW